MSLKKSYIASFLAINLIFISGCSMNSSLLSGDISGGIADTSSQDNTQEETLEIEGENFSHSDFWVKNEEFDLNSIIDSLEISEHESLEDPVSDTQIFQNTKTFGVISTSLSLTQIESNFQGVITFDTAYASSYLSEDNILNSTSLEKEIENSIAVAIPSGRCETTAHYIDQPNEENINGMYSSYNFEVYISCSEEPNTFGLSNALFTQTGENYVQIINILKQTETGDVWNIANAILTPTVPVFQYGNENQFQAFDNDGDGLLNDEEILYGTNPDTDDTDQDEISDMDEILKGRNPLIKFE